MTHAYECLRIRGYLARSRPQLAWDLRDATLFLGNEGKPLSLAWLSRIVALGIPEKPAAKAIAEAVRRAFPTWPTLIEASSLTVTQKRKLLEQFLGQRMVEPLSRRHANQQARPPQ